MLAEKGRPRLFLRHLIYQLTWTFEPVGSQTSHLPVDMNIRTSGESHNTSHITPSTLYMSVAVLCSHRIHIGRTVRYTPSSCLPTHVPIVNLTRENHTSFKLRGGGGYSHKQLLAEQFWRQKIKVTMGGRGGKGTAPCGAALLSYLHLPVDTSIAAFEPVAELTHYTINYVLLALLKSIWLRLMILLTGSILW